MKKLTIDSVIKALKDMCSEEDLQPYKDLGNGLYELPGNIIANENGLNEYLTVLRNKVKEKQQ